MSFEDRHNGAERDDSESKLPTKRSSPHAGVHWSGRKLSDPIGYSDHAPAPLPSADIE